ncbi:MAG TPA: antiterminator LoaP [Pseudobacteroides sp.]|uniref:antiterminator LoaP n=1 Tax=Pseudobacteroides sp. TaxID=1968840 RepID=UPI002F9287B2
MYWYVLFVLTGQEQKVKQILGKQLNGNLFQPFVPLHEQIFRSLGTVNKELKPLFPGYVFIESEVSVQEFINSISTIIYNSNDIVRVLKYCDKEIAIRESEKRMLLNLCNENYCVELSSGIIKGDRIYVTSGPLKGYESIIKKINRHKRLAWIEVEFLGHIKQVSVPLEIVERSHI